MEIPVLNRITELGAELSSIPDVNFPSRILSSFPGIEKISPSQHFWKWGAVIIALIATFTGLINKVKIFIISFKQKTNHIPSERENHDSVSNSNFKSSTESEDDDELRKLNEESDFRVKGTNRSLRRRHRDGGGGDFFAWSNLSPDRSVVKKWERVFLEDEFKGSAVSLYDFNNEREICSIHGGGVELTAACLFPLTPAVVLSAGKGGEGNVLLEVWDSRVGSRIPGVVAEWKSQSGKIVDVFSDDLKKVYMRDDMTDGIVVGDVRKVGLALEKSMEGDGVSWWDADGDGDGDGVMVLRE